MIKPTWEECFQDLLDNTLSEAEAQSLREEIARNAELKASFDAYRSVIETERSIASHSYELNENFVVKVMDALDERALRHGFLRRVVEMFKIEKRHIVAVATVCVLITISLYQMKYVPREALEAPTIETTGVQQPQDKEALKKTYGLSQTKRQEEANVPAAAGSSDETRNTSADLQKPSANTGVTGEKEGAALEPLSQKKEKRLEASAPQPLQERQAIGGLAQAEVEQRAQRGSAAAPAETSNLGDTDIGASDSVRKSMPWVPPTELDGRYRSVQHPSAESHETYASFEENHPTSPAENPISTFSIDVDTGSYTNARRFLQSGALPPSDSVRIEEFLNYFDYDYPSQTEQPFALSYEIAPSPLEKEKYLVRLALKARDSQRSDKPWNLVFLIDVSGSMQSPDKLALVQKALPVLVNGMRADDTVSIVTYAGNAGTLLDGGKGADKEKVLGIIRSLSAGGSTYGSGGIEAAYAVAKKNFIAGSTNRVILVTDGDFNVGVTSQDALKRLIEEKRKSGITLTTVGVGTGNLKDAAMEQLADTGNGQYFYLDTFKEARKIFETDLVGNMEVVAKDVKLQMEFNPQQVVQYRLIGYENRKLRREDFDNDAIDAGEIGSGHRVTALYEVVLANTEAANKLVATLRYQNPPPTAVATPDPAHMKEIGFLKIRFKRPESESSELSTFPLLTESVKQDVSAASADFRFAAAVSYFGHLLRNSKYTGKYSFADIAALAQKNIGSDAHGYRRELVELVRNASSVDRTNAD